MWQVERQLNETLFHKAGTRRNLQQIFRLEDYLKSQVKMEGNCRQSVANSQSSCSAELLLQRNKCNFDGLDMQAIEYSLEELESTLAESTLNETLNSLVPDVNEMESNGTVFSAIFTASTPLDKHKLVSKFHQDEYLDVGEITESGIQVKRDSPGTDSGLWDSLEILTNDSIGKETWDRVTLFGFITSSEENTGERSRNHERNDRQTDTRDHNPEIHSIYSYRDNGSWYWSESDPECADSVKTERSKGCKIKRNPEDLHFDDEGVLRNLKPKSASGRKKKKKKIVLDPSDKSDDSEPEIPEFSRRKKYTKIVRTCLRKAGKRVSHLEDRLCTQEEKKRRARIRSKDMRTLRQRFCKKEKFSANY